MKTAEALKAEFRAFVAEIATREDATLTEADETRAAEFETAIARAEKIEAQMRAIGTGETRSVETPDVRVPEQRTAVETDETRDDAASYNERSIDDFVGRAKEGESFSVRAPITTSSLWGGTANPTKKDLGFKATYDAPLGVLDVLPSQSIDEDTVSYAVEVLKPNAAKAVLEGEMKPEQAIEWKSITEALSVVAVHATMTRQALRSRSGLRAAAEGRLTYNVNAEVADQVLTGDGTGANVEGILSKGVQVLPLLFAAGTDGPTGQQIRAALRTAKTNGGKVSGVTPTHFVINPSDNDSLEAYLETTVRAISIGMTAIVDPNQPEGKILVGALGNPNVVEVLYRDSVEVTWSREHGENLLKNLETVLVEREASVAVYKPAALVEISFSVSD